jgi:membrane protein
MGRPPGPRWHHAGMSWFGRREPLSSPAAAALAPAAAAPRGWRARLAAWPWMQTLATLRVRFREDRLGLTAGSLTFTTLISLVPLVSVMLAAFTAFPIFGDFQRALERQFLQAFVPEAIALPVLRTLTQFAGKATGIGAFGLFVLVLTALLLMLTIDRTLNALWRVRRPRPLAQRVLVYWAAMTLGPLALGGSLALTSYALSASKGFVSALPGGLALLLNAIEFVLLAGALAGLYHFVPNTAVRWRHALAGAVVAAVAFEIAKLLLAWYVRVVPTFSVIYGAFATLPILLLWVYLGWVIVLAGAVIAAYAPSLQRGLARRPETGGERFQIALEAIGRLAATRGQGGMGLIEIAQGLRTDPLQVAPVLDELTRLDWVARLDETPPPRYVLLVEPTLASAAPLVQAFLLAPGAAGRQFTRAAELDRVKLAALLG